jgi:hypothetical protein
MIGGVGGTVATGGADCREGTQNTGARGVDRLGGNRCVRTGVLPSTNIEAAGHRRRSLAGIREQGTARAHRATGVGSRLGRIRARATAEPDLHQGITERGRVLSPGADHRAAPAGRAQEDRPPGGDKCRSWSVFGCRSAVFSQKTPRAVRSHPVIGRSCSARSLPVRLIWTRFFARQCLG